MPEVPAVPTNRSILESTKKILGVATEFKAFDLDIITHINSALSTLEQIGVGPAGGFLVEDEQDEWVHLLGGDPRLNQVKSYIYLRVRLIFDPPATSFAIDAIKEQIKEMEWRLQVVADPIEIVLPENDSVFGYPLILDGGGA